MMRSGLVLGGLVLVLVVVNGLVFEKERVLASETTLLLELAPRDPRSLMQGDYMELNYALASELRGEQEDGVMVVRPDAEGVARFVRDHRPDVPLAPDEHLLRYSRRQSRARFGAEAFYFQEGRAKLYRRAKYGELKVTESGDAVLVGLRDKDRQPLGAKRPAL